MRSLFGRPGERGRGVGGGEGDEEVGDDDGGAGVEEVCKACKACKACKLQDTLGTPASASADQYLVRSSFFLTPVCVWVWVLGKSGGGGVHI